jgi:two-component system, sensor histidine kinase and response regulator
VQGKEPAVDLEAIMERIDGDAELLRELVGLYLNDEARLLEEIAGAIAAGDADALRRAAHTLKGAVSNFCAPAGWSAAQALELAGRDARMSEAPALLATLHAELARVRQALEPFRP